jgi:ribulose-phosphate 3-epimerase
MKIINAPSLANCSFLKMGEQVEELVAGGIHWFHVDIMDGHYVPNLCFPVKIVGELKAAYPQIAVDVHLMTSDPMAYFPLLAEQKADYVSFHMDASNFSLRCLTTIKNLGMKAGVVINPSQRISVIEPVIGMIDYAVLMTVEPGYAGQRFLTSSLPRLSELVSLRKKSGRDFLISIDGGVDYPNAVECAKLGAEVYITGIYTVFAQPEGITEACKKFNRTLNEVSSK